MILHLLGLFLIVNSCRVPEEVDVKGVLGHLNELDKIANRFGGNRASGTVGYDESVDYVLAQLEKTRLQVSLQSFSYSVVDIIGTPKLEQTAPSKTHFLYETDFNVIQNSKDGSVQATVTSVPNLGCEEGDFSSFPKGNIALVKRGECPFAEKIKFAEEAGASAIIIYNNVAGLFLARVASKIPAFGLTHYAGLALSLETNVALSLTLVTKTTVTFTTNILAETPGGDPNKVIVVGSHLDGVTEGPGINDNGSGSANNLEIALAVDKCLKAPVNKIRFGWWAAEELGLLGSHFYVNALSPQERKRIALNLNFDMLGSPNHFYGIYNGTSAPEPIRGLSTAIQKQFERYFVGSRQPFELTPFDGRSDYGPFIEIGIPAGGLFTGAEGVKTLKQRNTYGGLANAWYDPCYHSYCDDFGNIAPGPLKSNLEAAASTLEYFALLHLRAEDLPTGDRTTVLPYDTHPKAVATA